MFQRQNNIRIDINRYFFTVDGELIVNPSVTLPTNLQTKLPWFMFGKFDYDCNYKNASHTLNPIPWVFIGCYDRSEVRFLFTGLNNFQSVMKSGELSLLFTDDLINPSYYALTVLSSQGGGLTGIIQNAEFYAPYFDLYSNNNTNGFNDDYDKSLLLMEVSKFGVAVKTDFLPLSRYYDPNTRPNNQKLGVNKDFTANYYNVLGGWIGFNTTAYYVDFRRISDVE